MISGCFLYGKRGLVYSGQYFPLFLKASIPRPHTASQNLPLSEKASLNLSKQLFTTPQTSQIPAKPPPTPTSPSLTQSH